MTERHSLYYLGRGIRDLFIKPTTPREPLLYKGWYLDMGIPIGSLAGLITFIGAWIYCMANYGFLFGFGLGWLPAIILAVMVGFATRYLWGPMAVALAVFAVMVATVTLDRMN